MNHYSGFGNNSSKPKSRLGKLGGKKNANANKPRSHIGELNFKPRSVPIPKAGTAVNGGVPEYMMDDSYYQQGSNAVGRKGMKQKLTSVFRRGGSNGTPNMHHGSLTAQQLSGQPVPLDDPIYRANVSSNAKAPTNDADLTTSTHVNISAEDEEDKDASDLTFTAMFPDMNNSSADSSFDRAINQGQRMASMPTAPSPTKGAATSGGTRRSSANTGTGPAARVPRSSATAASEEDPFAGMPTFDPDFDSVVGAVTSTRVYPAPTSVPALTPAPASRPDTSTTASSEILNQVRKGKQKAPTPTLQGPPAQRQSQPPQDRQEYRSPRPRPRAEMLQQVRRDIAKPSDSASSSTPFDEVKDREISTARDARRERLARQRMNDARTRSSPRPRPRGTAPDPPSSSEMKREADALNTSDEILDSAADAFFASSSPEEMASQFYVRSRSVSLRKARSQMAPPASTRTTNSRARSQSQGRAASCTISGLTDSGTVGRGRSRASSRSRTTSRGRSHRSKSRDGRDSASVVSGMSVDEEFRFLDVLAKHFPAESQMREYNPSSKSQVNARMMIDRQVHKICEERVQASATPVLSKPSSTPATIKIRPPRPSKSNSYGASLEAAAQALSVDNRSHHGAGNSVISGLTEHEEAYTHGLGRDEGATNRRRSRRAVEDDEDEFSAFGAIMSSDGSFPSRRT